MADLAQVGDQVFFDPSRDDGFYKLLGNFLVRQAAVGQAQQLVFFDKGIKALGGDNQRLGDDDVNIRVPGMQVGVALQQAGREGQSPGFSP